MSKDIFNFQKQQFQNIAAMANLTPGERSLVISTIGQANINLGGLTQDEKVDLNIIGVSLFPEMVAQRQRQNIHPGVVERISKAVVGRFKR